MEWDGTGEEEGVGLVSVYKSVKRECKEDAAKLFPGVPSDRTRGSGHKLKHKRFYMNIKKPFFTVRVMKCWHRLPREVMESASLAIFKS